MASSMREDGTDLGRFELNTLLAIGVEYLYIDPDEVENILAYLKGRNGYLYHDEVTLNGDDPSYDEVCAKFEKEHSHIGDEVRLVLEGEGIFDIRDQTDKLVSVRVEPRDLLIIPAGRHHRFRMTEQRHIRAIRLFKDSTEWTPFYREV